MKQKIGIITMYHNSKNYGGVLQAYALVKFLNDSGYEAEQVRFVGRMTERQRMKTVFSFGFKRGIQLCISNAKWMIKRTVKLLLKEKNRNATSQSKLAESFSKFRDDRVPHSKAVYNGNNIKKTNSEYDTFITGSDQVWNFAWYNPIYFLDFASRGKKKLSYAASVSMDSLNKYQKKVFKKSLRSYSAVSLREEESIGLIADASPVSPTASVDPTLLLSREDWSALAQMEVEREEYVFCYFIGSNAASRSIAKEYAEKHGLKLIGISHYHKYDGFDEELSDAGPEEFLSYIRNAKCVFTDSFHAVVFSKIFEKQYFVFNRDGKGSMGSRIRAITSLFETEERFCYGERENLEYVETLENIDYTRALTEFEKQKKASVGFLLDALEG